MTTVRSRDCAPLRRAWFGEVWVCALILSGVAGCASLGGSSAVQIRDDSVTIPTYVWGPDDVNPHFPWTHGRPIYPYPMQDNLAREKVDKTYDTLVLENKYLRVTVIPELGAHVHSVLDKTVDREIFYVNQVIRPGLIGLRGAFVSGGIEFNTGPQGHTVTAVSPIPCRFVDNKDGSKSIAIANIERVFRTRWQVLLTLRPERSFLAERIRIYNPTPHVHPYYFWNCTAVANTDGMQFVYPMTLGTDHHGTKFFRWPVDNGVDLSMSKNYRPPTSIFGYECDQDFFGSYDHGVDHGVVAYANHFKLPGKKAWTWGRGDEGTVAQRTLTDDGSLYNEVQTGPLATQSDYGLLRPHQAVEWDEWWYPVHGIGGFDYATREVAVKVTAGDTAPTIKMIGTATWGKAVCRIRKNGKIVAEQSVSISPDRPTCLTPNAQVAAPFEIDVASGDRTLARFTHPLPVPKHDPPDLSVRKNPMKTARDHWAAGVVEDKSARAEKARSQYEKALELQPDHALSHLSLAILDLESGLAEDAKKHLDQILLRDKDHGPANYHLAQALLGMGDETKALEHAWLAARKPASDSIALVLAGEICIRQGRWEEAIEALGDAWSKDPDDSRAWNLFAFALQQGGRGEHVETLGKELRVRYPLDPFPDAMQHLVLSDAALERVLGGKDRKRVAPTLLAREPQSTLEVAATLYRLKAYEAGLSVLLESLAYEGSVSTPVTYYYAGVFADLLGKRKEAEALCDRAAKMSPDYVFPDRLETIPVLEHAAKIRPNDWKLHHYRGCLYLAKYRKDEAVAAWKKALALHDKYSVVHRNLGLVCWKLDGDAKAAIAHFERAMACRSDDQTLYRDLAKLYQQTDQWPKARELLEKTLAFDRYRTDVIELLARTYHKLEQDDKAAKLIDTHTFDAWEAQRSLHNIFRDVHVSLGEKALEAGAIEKALAEFKRALEYPANLGVGRPETVGEAKEYYWLGKAQAAAGKVDEARKSWKRAAAEGSKEAGDYADLAAKAMKESEAR